MNRPLSPSQRGSCPHSLTLVILRAHFLAQDDIVGSSERSSNWPVGHSAADRGIQHPAFIVQPAANQRTLLQEFPAGPLFVTTRILLLSREGGLSLIILSTAA